MRFPGTSELPRNTLLTVLPFSSLEVLPKAALGGGAGCLALGWHRRAGTALGDAFGFTLLIDDDPRGYLRPGGS